VVTTAIRPRYDKSTTYVTSVGLSECVMNVQSLEKQIGVDSFYVLTLTLNLTPTLDLLNAI